tara:strand:- start:1530 stop:1865 length:336 start_codon:yes stop_codon:yes gene_type:complete
VQFSRNQKISRFIQKELSEVFLDETKNDLRGLIISVTHVFVSKDHSSAKIYLSFFPTNKKEHFLNLIKDKKNIIKNNFCRKTKGQLKKTPELFFYLDKSIDHYEEIDKLLK